MSIDDSVSEMQATFVARGVSPMMAVGRTSSWAVFIYMGLAETRADSCAASEKPRRARPRPDRLAKCGIECGISGLLLQ